MPRPVKWSRDVHAIRDRVQRSKTEIWSRQDIERLFGISRPSAQNLMKAIGNIQVVGGTHFVDRASLLGFLDEMIGADAVEEALRLRYETSAPVPRSTPLRVSLPEDLRRVTLADLPPNVEVRQGEVRITGASADEVLEGLVVVAQAMQNNFDQIRQYIDPRPSQSHDEELLAWLRSHSPGNV